MREKIGECLVHAGLVSEDDLRVALVEHRHTHEPVGVVLVRLKLATETQIAEALAGQLGFPYVNLARNPPDPTVVNLVSREIALERVCIPIGLDRNLLTVAMADPLQFSLVQDLEGQTGYRVRPVVATRGDIVEAIGTPHPDMLIGRPEGEDADVLEPAVGSLQNGEAVPIDLVDLLIKNGISREASDIHVDPTERCVLIRYRLDGLLKEITELPMWTHEGLIARVKAMAGLDINETRLPQAGRLRASRADGGDVDFRVSTLRTLFGERVVMRVLDHRKRAPAIEEIGMSAAALGALQGFLRHGRGMILVVGPAGSGRTTTLSSALGAISAKGTNIITIEDPIEYQIPGGPGSVVQTQIDEKLELTYASALRSVLRQDPDVILVGEIRDAETATLAMQAAQDGRLLLSALHADDAPSAVTRLFDLGAEPGLMASTLVGVVAQRLVRRLCVHCRRQSTPQADTLRALQMADSEAAAIPVYDFFKAVGCDQCHYTGYRGRIGIYQVMKVNDTLRRLISLRATGGQLSAAAIAGGMTTLGEDALAKVKSGVTTPEELLRVVTEAGEMRALCSSCGGAVAVDFTACPLCGARLDNRCRHCGRSLEGGWSFCPYCARSTRPGTLPGPMA